MSLKAMNMNNVLKTWLFHKFMKKVKSKFWMYAKNSAYSTNSMAYSSCIKHLGEVVVRMFFSDED